MMIKKTIDLFQVSISVLVLYLNNEIGDILGDTHITFIEITANLISFLNK